MQSMDALNRFYLSVNVIQLLDVGVRLVVRMAALRARDAQNQSRTEDSRLVHYQSRPAQAFPGLFNVMTIPCSPTSQFVYFIDELRNIHLVHLSACAKTQDIVRFAFWAFWAFRGSSDPHLRLRLQRGEFWLLPEYGCSAPSGNYVPLRYSIVDSGRQLVLADNYERTVQPGAVFYLRSPPDISKEACDVLHATWGAIPGDVRQQLVAEFGLT
ncbi:hypothetical protein PV08_05965 [Exophiala spinifera]|uniref:Uncharacterized protein n=1 Tax=Exophiala spinifera TaxID=91928 RepID=A0A0D2BBE0_9EURO|nr:uncharacterized protein PV08_05965 [Exophiala spinifera]KIW15915.1 hypothetical protein PV08_05965 [Exophiala spinifera]